MLRVVLDTNVFVSGLLSKAGPPAKALNAWRGGQYFLAISPPILAEIRQILESPRIAKKYPIAREDVEQLIELLEKDAIVVPGLTDVKEVIPEDPDDKMFLACALDGAADFIVSGDRHLLDLAEYRGIPIITVEHFAEQLAKQGAP